MNLLLVDDEVFALEALQQTIPWQKLGIEQVFSCHNCTAARKLCIQNEIHIVICDIEMPNETGLDLARWLHEQYPKILILFLTCHSDFSYAKEAISYRAFAYLLKPFNKDELCQTIQDAVATIRKRKYRDIPVLQTSAGEHPAVSDKSAADNPEQIVQQILSMLQKDVTISRDELARRVYLSPDYMTRIFKRSTGKTLSEYTGELKLNTAKHLLAETDEPVGNIAVSLAYVNFSYFSKVFKAGTGMSPKEYRKKHRAS